jgi:hypothetical protein
MEEQRQGLRKTTNMEYIQELAAEVWIYYRTLVIGDETGKAHWRQGLENFECLHKSLYNSVGNLNRGNY